uniref:LAGLIDADG homing endonuclease n=1 Tax=Blastosporella zonata TaxID=530045 RepID=A0A386TXZ6_9AGAR|nr:LAGLIDADG homing endonuclease [Blastosporella zonata]AYE93089.1 LAGLIDADG homing endonuclease [Blastosporella zonata]
MLGSFNALNTSRQLIYSNKVKVITISNQQETKYKYFLNIKKLGPSETAQEGSFYLINKNLERLRYSPTNIDFIYLYLSSFILFFKNKFLNIKINNFSTNPFSTKSSYPFEMVTKGINPYWITGFTDAEGCFSIIVEILATNKWRLRTSFEINLHIKDVDILYQIKEFFGVGNVYLRSQKNIAVYRVSNLQYINEVIIPHFKKYTLITKKSIDFNLWCKVINMISNKQHLSESGFLTILNYYASINRGMSKKVLNYYPDIKPVTRPKVELPLNLNPHWVSGFVAGDGGFSIVFRSSNSIILKQQVSCRFQITQHIKDIELMNLFSKFFNCGTVYVRSNSSHRCDFVVQDINLLLSNIIPHFEIYPIFNLKYQDYICFKKALNIIKQKQHLTLEGLDFIKTLKLEMNSNRLK